MASITSRAAIRLLLLAFLATGGSGPTHAEADPFYFRALVEGRAAYAAADFALAAQRFRIACFGLLDEPPILAEGLVHLALAQASLKDGPAFLETFERLEEIEDRFGAYSQARMAQAVRNAFEAQATALVPTSTLRASRTFARLARVREMRRIGELKGGERIAALQSLLQDQPEEPLWQRMLARARVEAGQGDLAVELLDAILATSPADAEASCLRGRAYLQMNQCQMSQADALRCDIRGFPVAEIGQYLDCLTTADRWLEAASVVLALPPEKRGARTLWRREKRIARAIPEEVEIEALGPFEDPPVAEVPAAAGSTPAPSTESTPTAAPLALPPPRREIDALRQRLDGARSAEELAAVVADVERLLRGHPQSRDLLYLGGEAAYRASDWRSAAEYLQRDGRPPSDRPELLFYLSVSLFELGNQSEAARVLRTVAPYLQRTAIVERYLREILGEKF